MMALRNAIAVLCCFCFFFLFSLFAETITAQNSTSGDVLLINCGATGKLNDQGGREWQGDVGSKYLPPSAAANSAVATAPNQGSAPAVPYVTARVFTAPFTYSIPVPPDRKFVRLYFYPAAYGGRNASAAVFDVTAAYDASDYKRYTLLRNFTPEWNTVALNLEYIVKEYSLNVSQSGFFNLTFTPSTTYNGSYAFVNGIELVSMPDIFAKTGTVTLVGANPGATYGLNTTIALETMYRLNVGGQAVDPKNDSGLYRTWGDDSLYIFGAATGLTHSMDSNITLTYPNATPKYAAPDLVYETQRSMTGDVTINRQMNLTWLFTVDPGFYYMVRLHFCEIQSQYNKPNERVFNIYINNASAENGADVFAWATQDVGSVSQGSALGVPFYKDYATFLPNGAEQVDLRLDLHPNDDTRPEFFDAVLNGLEIFKLNNNSDFNLAGIKPAMPPTVKAVAKTFHSTGGGHNAGAIAGGVVGGVVVLTAVAIIAFFLYNRRMRQIQIARKDPFANKNNMDSSTLLPTSSHYSMGSTLPSNLCRHFTLQELADATQGFDEKLIIGEGGFGRVYRGEVWADDSVGSVSVKNPSSTGKSTKVQVAIKRANPTSEQGQQGINEFINEIEMLSKLRHRHLVSLIGFCDEQGEMILVYDYMANGTLRQHLYNKKGKPTLGWRQRMDVCIGAARGLHYLHTGARPSIIHRDVKTTNILLDDAFVAKVADFGLSKAGPEMGQQETHVSTFVKGSFGYLDPEYFRRQQLTEKSDVYSFGVVLFEVICGRPVLNQSLPKEQVSLADWARYCYKKGVLEDIMDPQLRGKIAPKCYNKFVEVAANCTADRGTDRPTMGDVLWSLEFALQQQVVAEEEGPFEGVGGDVISTLSSCKTDSDKLKDTSDTTGMSTNSVSLASIDSDGLTPSVVFSQIIDPKGR